MLKKLPFAIKHEFNDTNSKNDVEGFFQTTIEEAETSVIIVEPAKRTFSASEINGFVIISFLLGVIT